MIELCSICREFMDEKKQHYMLRCNHRFHTECIIDSLRANNECPICRDTDGYKSSTFSSYNDISLENDNNLHNKKKISKIKLDDINNILKLMNEIIDSDANMKKLKTEIKNDMKLFKKYTNTIHRNIKSFQYDLDKKYKDDINKYLINITSSQDFEKGINSKNIYINKIADLHKYIYNQIINMGIPNTALNALHYNSIIRIQFEKNNGIYIDHFYNDFYKSICKSIKKVNNNDILTI